jgi:ATP-dependent exoDNAse (exonuclease V) alpha subunit
MVNYAPPAASGGINESTSEAHISPDHRPTGPQDFEVTEQFREILDLLSLEKPPVLFVTGSAGTGKSTLIEVLRHELDRNIVVLAPTGVAALNVRGQTIHSFFQLAPGPQPTARKLHGAARDVVAKMDILVIDEVSMVRADLLDAIDDSLRRNSGKPAVPFGGKTVVLIGDMHQLPPVIAGGEEARLFEESYESPYFFSAYCMQSLPLVTRTLTQSFRQTDKHFVGILNDLRVGQNLPTAVAMLNELVNESPDDESMLILTSINARARRFNEQQLDALSGDTWCYTGEAEGEWMDSESQLPSPSELRLKRNAQVMFTKNGLEWVNGTIGRVVDLDDGAIEVELLSEPHRGLNVVVERESWERYRYKWDENRGRVNSEVIGSYTQFPFILAWAVTVHKAQGLTLNRIRIDLGRGMFAPGQAYVALSRCRTLEGISFNRPLSIADVKCDPAIQLFYADIDR